MSSKPPPSPDTPSSAPSSLPPTGDPPGLVARIVPPVADAVPTEDEGDALFDELFGAFDEQEGDEAIDAGDSERPPAGTEIDAAVPAEAADPALAPGGGGGAVVEELGEAGDEFTLLAEDSELIPADSDLVELASSPPEPLDPGAEKPVPGEAVVADLAAGTSALDAFAGDGAVDGDMQADHAALPAHDEGASEQAAHDEAGVSVDDMSVDDVSVEDVSVDDVSVEDVSVDDVSVDDVSVEDVSVDDVSVEGEADPDRALVAEVEPTAEVTDESDGQAEAPHSASVEASPVPPAPPSPDAVAPPPPEPAVEQGDAEVEISALSDVRAEELALTDARLVEAEQSAFMADAVDPSQQINAAASLVQSGDLEAWLHRAEWLLDEAPGSDQPAARAAALVVIAELFAMVSEETRAEELLAEAQRLAPSSPVVQRQRRGLLMARGDWEAVLEALDAETKIAPTPAAQAHAACLGAEIARLVQGDAEGASHRLELATRALGSDLRPHLFRLASALGTTDEVPPLSEHVPAAVHAATAGLRALRSSGSADITATAGGSSPAVHGKLLRTRAALRQRDVAEAIEGLKQLQAHRELLVPAAWLASVLGAPHADLRSRSIAALGRVVGGSHGTLALRCLACRAVEVGDTRSVMRLANAASAAVLGAGDRLVLAALHHQLLEEGERLDKLDTWLEEAAATEALEPLAAAASVVLREAGPSVERSVGSAVARAQVELGRALAGGDADGTVAAAEALVAADSGAGVARAVLLEEAYARGRGVEVAELLLGRRDAELATEEPARERGLARAMLAAIRGDHETMTAVAREVAEVAPDDESALRAALGELPPERIEAVFAAHAAACDTGELAVGELGVGRRAVILSEGGLRLMRAGRHAEADAMLHAAAEAMPELPVADGFGLLAAQTRSRGEAQGDLASQRRWLEQRRARATAPVQVVEDLLREARAVEQSAPEAATALLDDAHRRRPADYSLRELAERAGAGGSRAAWVMDHGPDAGEQAAWLSLEAAIAFELDGDPARAEACAARAMAAGDRDFAPIVAARVAEQGHGVEAAIESAKALLSAATDARVRRDHTTRLARLEQLAGEGDGLLPADRAVRLLREVAEEHPRDLLVLRQLEMAAIGAGDADALHDAALGIGRALDGPEATGHAMLAARLRLAQGRWDDAYPAVDTAFAQLPRDVWALRAMSAHALARRDHLRSGETSVELAETAQDATEKATLLLRAAEAAMSLDDLERASTLLDEALQIWPQHHVVLLQRAALAARAGHPLQAAERYEELARVTQAPRQRAAWLYRAAKLWLTDGGEPGRDEGQRLLEAVIAVDPAFDDAFERLQRLYEVNGDKRKLAALLAARLPSIDDPEERVRLEVLRGQTLAQAGDAAEAKRSLKAALDASPDHAEALASFADVCETEGDWDALETALLRLGRLSAEPGEQAEVYLRLGRLYDVHLPNPDRAERAYLEVLKLTPDSARARDQLVALYLSLGETDKAFEQQQALVDAATLGEERCARTTRLAEIYEAAGDLAQAEATLVKARRTWSKEASAVEALHAFCLRHGRTADAEELVERAASEVERGLEAGRFEVALFTMAVTVYELRGHADAARVARATLAAVHGERTPSVVGGGLKAASPELDEVLAPPAFSGPFRELLSINGGLLDVAMPVDLKRLRARPFKAENDALRARVHEIAAAYGFPEVELYASNALGKVCMPGGMKPPTLVFGVPLMLEEDEPVVDFLVHRALKVLQSSTAPLARTAPIDLWPLLGAFLKVHSPSFDPPGADQDKLDRFYESMTGDGPKRMNPRLNLMAIEVSKTMGSRASNLHNFANSWGSRAALLALGDPAVAIEAMAWATGRAEGAPTEPDERMKWISRQAEARDLVVFSLSEAHMAARRRLGLGDAHVAERPDRGGERAAAIESEEDVVDVDDLIEEAPISDDLAPDEHEHEHEHEHETGVGGSSPSFDHEGLQDAADSLRELAVAESLDDDDLRYEAGSLDVEKLRTVAHTLDDDELHDAIDSQLPAEPAAKDPLGRAAGGLAQLASAETLDDDELHDALESLDEADMRGLALSEAPESLDDHDLVDEAVTSGDQVVVGRHARDETPGDHEVLGPSELQELSGEELDDDLVEDSALLDELSAEAQGVEELSDADLEQVDELSDDDLEEVSAAGLDFDDEEIEELSPGDIEEVKPRRPPEDDDETFDLEDILESAIISDGGGSGPTTTDD